MRKLKFYLALILLSFLSILSSTLSAQSLLQIKPPSDLENVKVVKLSTDKNSSNYLIFIKKSVAPHQHIKHSESIYVISGEALFTMAGKSFRIQAGDFINVPQATTHSVKVTSDLPLKVLSNQAPEFLGKDRVYVK